MEGLQNRIFASPTAGDGDANFQIVAIAHSVSSRNFAADTEGVGAVRQKTAQEQPFEDLTHVCNVVVDIGAWNQDAIREP